MNLYGSLDLLRLGLARWKSKKKSNAPKVCWIYFLLEAIITYCSPTKVVAWGQWSAALLTTLPFLISYGCSNNTVRLLCCRMLFCAIFPLNGTNLITINQFEKKITALAESSERDLVALGPISAHFYGHPMRAMYTKREEEKSSWAEKNMGRKVV